MEQHSQFACDGDDSSLLRAAPAAATMGESPTLIEALTSLRSILGRSSFKPIEREAISLAVSVANDCSYCVAAHSTFARMQGAPEDLIEALRSGETPSLVDEYRE